MPGELELTVFDLVTAFITIFHAQSKPGVTIVGAFRSPADVVIDLVGNDQTLASGMKMLRKGGSLIIVGYGGGPGGRGS